jgi:hypothetical protein
MSFYSSQIQSTEPTEVQQVVRFVGGAAAVTKLAGRGITINYIGTGIVDLVWADAQGVYLGLVGFAFDATTPTQVAGYTVVAGDYNTATRTLRLNINTNANALVDLTATQRLSIRPSFKLFNT